MREYGIIKVKKSELMSIVHEMVSACSSLNMEPESRALKANEDHYIVNTDAWANHAYSHIVKAQRDLIALIDRKRA